jgi:hypothetical protein
VIARFWIKLNEDVEISANVNTSSRMENLTVLVAVTDVPAAVAVTTRSVNGVTAVGSPVITPVVFNDNPVPVNAGADKVMARPEAAVAAKRIFDV